MTIPTGLISTLPAALEVIEGEAFANSRLLQFVEIPASVMDIDPVAFSGFSDQLVIITTAGSYAETFAAEHGIICIAR